jgi:hypothetical protein
MNNTIDKVPYVSKKYKFINPDNAINYINCWWESLLICPISKPTKKAKMTYEISLDKDNQQVLFVNRKIKGEWKKIPYYRETVIKNIHALTTGLYPDGSIAVKKDINHMSVLRSIFNHSLINFNEENEIPRDILLKRLKSFKKF